MSAPDADRMRAAVSHLATAAQRLAELLLAPSDAHGASGAATSERTQDASRMAGPGAVYSAPSYRPRVLGLDESEARLLLANALAVLEHARGRIHSSRKPQLDAVAGQIRTALDGQRGRNRGGPSPDPGSVAVAA